MLTLLLLLLISLAGSFFATAIFHKRFEETLPISISGIPIIMFFTGLLSGLKASFYIILGLCGILFVVAVLQLIITSKHSSKHYSLRQFRQSFFTPAFFLFIGLFLLLIYVNYDRPANRFDEFSHWMDTVRAMVSLDDFGTNPHANTLFASYPPGVSLFQYFTQELNLMLQPNAGFQEWYCYIAYQLLVCSFFFPLLKKTTWRRFLSTGVLLILIYLSPLMLYDVLAINTCYMEPFLGIVTGSGFAILFARKKIEWCNDITLFVLMFTLVLAKDNGIFFAAFLGIGILIRLILECRFGDTAGWKVGLHQKRLYIILGLTALSILLPKILWTIYYTSQGVSRRFSNPMDLRVIINVLLHRDNSWHRLAMDTYAKAYFTGEQGIGTLNIRVSYPILLLLLLTGLVLIYYLWKKLPTSQVPGQRIERSARERQLHPPSELAHERWISIHHRSTILIIFLMASVYSFGMSVFYIFNFGESGSLQLLSMDRYLRVPYIAMLEMGLLLFLAWYTAYKDRLFLSFLLGILLMGMIIPATSFYSVMSRESVSEQKAFREPYNEIANRLLAEVGEGLENTKVFIISQGDPGIDYYALRYCLRPCASNGWAVITDGEVYEGARLRSPEEWKQELQEYDYVVLYHVDEVFLKEYGSLFELSENEQISDRQIYQIDHETDTIKLMS